MENSTSKHIVSAFNLDEALARVDGDWQLLGELATLFLEECPHMLAEIREALAAQDPKALQHSAHTLKGSVGNFGAVTVFHAALTLEKMGRQQDLSTASDALVQLEAELARLQPELATLAAEETA